MTDIFARKALLQNGWADDVRLRVQAGEIVQIDQGVAVESGGVETGIVIPGLCNAHSHAFQRALAGGAQAAAQPLAGLQVGARADLVALFADDPMLVGHDDASLLDALVFSGYRLPIERVLVNGSWRVIDGDHVDRADIRRQFSAALARIGVAG